MRGQLYPSRLGLQPHEQGQLYHLSDTNSKLQRALTTQFADCYAYYNHDSLICYIGTDKQGQVSRLYDVVSLHEDSNPGTPDPEEYTVKYIACLHARYESYGNYMQSTNPVSFRQTAREHTERSANIKIELDKWLRCELVTYMNRYLAVITETKSFVISKRVDIVGGVLFIRLQQHDTNTLVNTSTYTTATVPGDEKKNVAAWWMKCNSRREYESITFSVKGGDRALNLWHGFPIANKLTNANPDNAIGFLRFIRDGLANGNVQVSNYIIRWLAWIVQHPLERPDVALIIKSPQGAGKGYVFVEVMSGILGEYHKYLRDTQACGRFNMTLANCRLLILDEPGFDAKQASLMKQYITNPILFVEEKGLPLI